jgi:RNA polymerase sigma factor (sigma-70 family)
LQRLAGAYVDAREDREDLVQEIAAALWRALPNYRAESSERTWLYRIAHNVAITATVKQRQACDARSRAGSAV